MNENEQKKNRIVILGLIALILALFLGIKLIFAGLAVVISDSEQPPAQSIGAGTSVQELETGLPAPSYCPNCGDKLPESFQWGQYCPYCGEKVE